MVPFSSSFALKFCLLNRARQVIMHRLELEMMHRSPVSRTVMPFKETIQYAVRSRFTRPGLSCSQVKSTTVQVCFNMCKLASKRSNFKNLCSEHFKREIVCLCVYLYACVCVVCVCTCCVPTSHCARVCTFVSVCACVVPMRASACACACACMHVCV
jgi:hypothetical protein